MGGLWQDIFFFCRILGNDLISLSSLLELPRGATIIETKSRLNFVSNLNNHLVILKLCRLGLNALDL